MSLRATCALAVLAIATAPASHAGDATFYKVVHSFTSKVSEGTVEMQWPNGGPVADLAGRLYGTTQTGGQYKAGSVWRLTPPRTLSGTWTSEVLYSFQSGPTSGVLLGPSGELYGTIFEGGKYNLGVVYRLDPFGSSWKLTTLHEFGETSRNGIYPDAGLAFGLGGRLYGTTSSGGLYRAGTVFSIDPSTGGTYRVLHNFGAAGDGSFPGSGSLLVNGHGALYGTTYRGGAHDRGTAFKLIPPGPGETTWHEKILHSFNDGDGAYPVQGLRFGPDKSLYGCGTGGAFGMGEVYQLTPPGPGGIAWGETVLYSFSDVARGRVFRECTVARAVGSALVGVTDIGGLNGSGVVFRLAPSATPDSWTETVLHDFGRASRKGDGSEPVGQMLVGHGAVEGGAYFGVTSRGGTQDQGTVFAIKP